MKERFKVFDQALNRLLAQGKITKEQLAERQKGTNAKFNTLESTPYNKDEKKGSAFLKNSVATEYVTNKFGEDTIKDLDDKFNEYEESGVLEIES